MKFKGAYVALVTPYDEQDNVNYNALADLIEFQIASNIDGLVILGTTAEATTLTDKEKEEIVKFVVSKVNHRIPIIVGSGSNSTKIAIENSIKYERLGADALLVITPYYNKTNSEGMIKHFEAVADNVNIPIIMYNVPSRTGISLKEEEIAVLSKHKNIQAIKEASGNISFVAKIAKYVSDSFEILSGNDDQIVPLMSLGASGVVSVLANICPNSVHLITEYMLNGKYKEANELQLRYLDLANALFLETNPIPIKDAMNYMGYNVGECRLPLYKMSLKNADILHNEIDELGDLIKWKFV